jgi:hypothetical protein
MRTRYVSFAPYRRCNCNRAAITPPIRRRRKCPQLRNFCPGADATGKSVIVDLESYRAKLEIACAGNRVFALLLQLDR